MNAEKTGQLIAQRRRELGLSQAELAKLIHVTDKAVSRWETGRGFPAIDSLEPLAEALGLTVSELLSGQQLTPEEVPKMADAQLILGMHRERRMLWRGMTATLLAVTLCLCSWLGWHWLTSVSEDDRSGLEAHVNAGPKQWYEFIPPDADPDRMTIRRVERRGNYLAILSADPEGHSSMTVLDPDPVFPNRWRNGGGKPNLPPGTLSSWNFGSPAKEAVIIFCGLELPEEAKYYTFTNSGIRYLCPIEDREVLDIFIVPDGMGDISSYPEALLDKNMKPL